MQGHLAIGDTTSAQNVFTEMHQSGLVASRAGNQSETDSKGFQEKDNKANNINMNHKDKPYHIFHRQ